MTDYKSKSSFHQFHNEQYLVDQDKKYVEDQQANANIRIALWITIFVV